MYLLSRARAGDDKSMQEILEIFQPQMENHAKMIKMPKEDVIQSLKSELILYIKGL